MHQKSLIFLLSPTCQDLLLMVVCTHFLHLLYLSLLIGIVLMFAQGYLQMN